MKLIMMYMKSGDREGPLGKYYINSNEILYCNEYTLGDKIEVLQAFLVAYPTSP